MTIRAPKTQAAATALLERYAELEGQAAAIEGRRARMLARANAAADAKAGPLLQELAAISAKLETWWSADGKALLPKGRKSMQLGGCSIGSRSSQARLVHGFDNDDAAVEALRATRHANQTTRIRHALDREAITGFIEAKGKTGASLKGLGFRIQPGTDTFFVARVKQAGTIGS